VWGEYWIRGETLCLNPYEVPDPAKPCDRWTRDQSVLDAWIAESFPQFFIDYEEQLSEADQT
jgi:hypothetical protein